MGRHLPSRFRNLRFLVAGMPLEAREMNKVVRDRRGDIRLRVLPSYGPGEVNVLYRLAPERGYRPKSDSEAAHIQIVKGSGTFYHCGSIITYGPNSDFAMNAGELYGFNWVMEETFFIKQTRKRTQTVLVKKR